MGLSKMNSAKKTPTSSAFLSAKPAVYAVIAVYSATILTLISVTMASVYKWISKVEIHQEEIPLFVRDDSTLVCPRMATL